MTITAEVAAVLARLRDEVCRLRAELSRWALVVRTAGPFARIGDDSIGQGIVETLAGFEVFLSRFVASLPVERAAGSVR